MANTLQTQSRKVALWKNRPVIVLNETDPSERHFHGVMIGPKDLSIQDALTRLDIAFEQAVASNRDDWNYDHVITNMENAGFESILAAAWDECYAPMPPDKYIWIRCGDEDVYNRRKRLIDAAAYLKEQNVAKPLYRSNGMGLTDNNRFVGHNYISIYWGGQKADEVGYHLTEEEIKNLNSFLDLPDNEILNVQDFFNQ